MFFFFFQAEDGIRDSSVTGVQTCALPICLHGSIAVFLKDIDGRTTVTKGHPSNLTNCYDRLTGMSAPYSNPDGCIIPRAEIVPGLFQNEGMSAQIHGGLRIHNIDKVVFMNPKELSSSRLIELLDQHQIKYEFAIEETIPQEIAQEQIEVSWKAYNNEIAR